MGGSQKSKRVTWASDVNLCQVRLFLSEESPSQVGMGTQDHLQAKAGGLGSDDNLPPGFEEFHPANPWIARLSQIPIVKWKCPPRFTINPNWQVVAGEESREVEAQSQRELAVLEAIYPRPTAIPQNPSVSVDVETESYNDQLTPAVPITAIEDEDAVDPDIAQPQNLPPGAFSSQGSASPHHQTDGISAAGLDPDIVAAAQAALSSIMSTGDQGSLIDHNLLIEILSNPTMIEQLLENRAASSTSMHTAALPSSLNVPPSSSFQVMPAVTAQTVASLTTQHGPSLGVQVMSSVGMRTSAPSSAPGMHNVPSTSAPPPPYVPGAAINRREPPISAHMVRPELGAPPRPPPGGPFYPPTHIPTKPNHRPTTPEAISAPPPSMARDMSYYKNLIQQHGGERREAMQQQLPHQGNQSMLMTSQDASTAMKPREPKHRISRPCIYFNTPRGCRNGANCMYQHDTAPSQMRPGSMSETQSAKRMKLDKEITGN